MRNEIEDAISEIELRIGDSVIKQMTSAGLAVGVQSSKKGVYNCSLIPIDKESLPRFIQFMVSGYLAEPKGDSK